MGPAPAAWDAAPPAGGASPAPDASAPEDAAARPRPVSLRRQVLWVLAATVALTALLVGMALSYLSSMDTEWSQVETLLQRTAQAAEAATGPADGTAPARGARVLADESRALAALAAHRSAQAAARGRTLAITLGATALVGLLLLGAVCLVFVVRLTRDIDLLRRHAQAVIAGDRHALGEPSRRDELGELARAQDQMLRALAAREHDLDIERRHLFHTEKMAALGALAGGVLNDIGNPIAAIDGIAQAMRDAMSPAERDAVHPLCDPLLILQQTRRLQLITRQIAELAAPPSTERSLLNLNEVVGSTLLLLHFDARMSGVRVRTGLDPQLPALHGVGDALVQVLMNLLVNAADALAEQPPAQPLIVVETAADGKGGVVMRVIDNGVGMDATLLQRAFEPMFTTKPPGRGTGLGLPLCRRIAAEHGGRIELQSVPGAGTVATLLLPAAPSA